MRNFESTATALFISLTGNLHDSVVVGQNAVVVIGRNEVLRLPRTPGAAGRLDFIERLGRILGPQLPIPIPQPRVHRMTLPHAGTFSIERRLPGEPLSRTVVSDLPAATQRSLARQLFDFLRVLHGIDPNALRSQVSLPVVNPREEWNDLLRRARSTLAAWWSPALEQKLLDEAAQFNSTFDDGPVTTLRHGDFGGANILFDHATEQATAILDFELAADGDPVYDYASASTLGAVVTEALLDAAGLSASQRRRVGSYRASFPLQEALWAVAAGDLDDVPRALAAYDGAKIGGSVVALTIRRAVAADAPSACDTVRRSIAELCVQDHQGDAATITAWLANKTEANLTRWISSDQRLAFVAEEAARIVGFGLLDPAGSILLLYVSPDARFRGVSKALLAAMEDVARSVGVHTVTLDSSATARRFYERAGYASRGEPKKGFGITTCYPMSKQLTP
jgi:aminoglycoside phosphotransferase (APT) family kinase protein